MDDCQTSWWLGFKEVKDQAPVHYRGEKFASAEKAEARRASSVIQREYVMPNRVVSQY